MHSYRYGGSRNSAMCRESREGRIEVHSPFISICISHIAFTSIKVDPPATDGMAVGRAGRSKEKSPTRNGDFDSRDARHDHLATFAAALRCSSLLGADRLLDVFVFCGHDSSGVQYQFDSRASDLSDGRLMSAKSDCRALGHDWFLIHLDSPCAPDAMPLTTKKSLADSLGEDDLQ